MGRRRFAAQHFLALLRLIDEELTEPATVTVIGGAALGLVCLEQHLTTDLDVEAMTHEAFWQAVRRAQARLEDPPVVESVSIAQPPYDYEDRLTRLPLGGAGRLTVLLPDPHDVALMKMSRGEEHDFEALEAVHALRPFSLDQLVAAYEETRIQYVGRVWELKLNFLELIARLFGRAVAEDLEPRLNG